MNIWFETILRFNKQRINSLLILLACSAFLIGCQNIPKELELENDAGLSLTRVQQQAEAFAGQTVRWGGTVVRVDNAAQHSRIEIVAYPLNEFARPRLGLRSEGRFIAEVKGFVDPMVFTQGREVTVTGAIAGSVSGSIGEFDYLYPLLEVQASKLWQPRTELELVPIHRPYWYDPWYPYNRYYYY